MKKELLILWVAFTVSSTVVLPRAASAENTVNLMCDYQYTYALSNKNITGPTSGNIRLEITILENGSLFIERIGSEWGCSLMEGRAPSIDSENFVALCGEGGHRIEVDRYTGKFIETLLPDTKDALSHSGKCRKLQEKLF
jgi:hypothetical protein